MDYATTPAHPHRASPSPCCPPRSLPSVCFGYAEEGAEVEAGVVSLSM